MEPAIEEFGGKAKGLLWLKGQGFNVPNFNVLTTAESKNALHVDQALLATLVSDLEYSSDSEARLILGATIRHHLEQADIELAAVKNLSSGLDLSKPLAVRSSAVNEDSSQTSSAGQFETVIGRFSMDGLGQAIKKVIASYYADRAIVYRAANSISQNGPSMAVVVQQLIEPDSAGIAFTCDPVTADNSVIIIEGSFGLGLPVVSGDVAPDRFVVKKANLRILKKHRGSKYVVAALANGELLITKLNQGETSYCLSDDEIVKIASICVSIESSVGYPQDIEWAINKGTVYLLQTRPITSVKFGGTHEFE